MKKIIPSEHQEQLVFVRYCKIKKISVFAIPNGTYLNGTALQRAKQMNRLKAEGLEKGVPDLFIPIASSGKHGLFVEMKRQKGGTASLDQKKWIELLNEANYRAVICKGANEAIKEIEEYLNNGSETKR